MEFRHDAMEPRGWIVPRAAAERRISTLEAWLDRQMTRVEQLVRLPKSGREYAIHLPDDESLERLFAEAKAIPGEPLPWWAKVWPSGVAMADVAVERREELDGRRVLELGCGLGVTATAVLEAGAELVAVDYSPLPLGLCRYNALLNTGRSPRTVCCNWHVANHEALTRGQETGGFPVIIAADVLYESPDIAPLLSLVEHLLAPDGVLWLAEPGRRTADRFLNVAAAAWWQGTSERASGPWPDGSAVHVNLHFLRRPTRVDPTPAMLGGWRV